MFLFISDPAAFCFLALLALSIRWLGIPSTFLHLFNNLLFLCLLDKSLDHSLMISTAFFCADNNISHYSYFIAFHTCEAPPTSELMSTPASRELPRSTEPAAVPAFSSLDIGAVPSNKSIPLYASLPMESINS